LMASTEFWVESVSSLYLAAAASRSWTFILRFSSALAVTFSTICSIFFSSVSGFVVRWRDEEAWVRR
jgi:hypothetical protein